MENLCPNCEDKPVACIAKEYEGKIFCGVCCIREWRKNNEKEVIVKNEIPVNTS